VKGVGCRAQGVGCRVEGYLAVQSDEPLRTNLPSREKTQTFTDPARLIILESQLPTESSISDSKQSCGRVDFLKLINKYILSNTFVARVLYVRNWLDSGIQDARLRTNLPSREKTHTFTEPVLSDDS